MSLDKGTLPEFDASPYRFAIVAARFNKTLVDALVRDAISTLSHAGVDASNVRLVRVPGSAELPHVCNMLARTDDYDAIIALGVVIAGETPHHEIIGNSTANALQMTAMETTVPIINGIIVANNQAQAEARTLGKIRRGVEFAEAAMEMAWQASMLLDELIEAENMMNASDFDCDCEEEIFDMCDSFKCQKGCQCGGSFGPASESDSDGFFEDTSFNQKMPNGKKTAKKTSQKTAKKAVKKTVKKEAKKTPKKK